MTGHVVLGVVFFSLNPRLINTSRHTIRHAQTNHKKNKYTHYKKDKANAQRTLNYRGSAMCLRSFC